MYAGSGTDLLGGGAGNETFFAGHGNATVIGGSGADLYGFVNGLAGGTETVFGFNTAKGDLISLQGYGPNEAQNDLANAAVAGGNTTLTLSDHTQVTFMGVTNLNASAFVYVASRHGEEPSDAAIQAGRTSPRAWIATPPSGSGASRRNLGTQPPPVINPPGRWHTPQSHSLQSTGRRP